MNHVTLPYTIDAQGRKRPLGNRPAPHSLSLPLVGSGEVIPESEWREFEYVGYPLAVKDQNGYGACNGFAASSALELARWIAGLPHAPLSAWSIYARLCNGWDRGSSIAEALALLSTEGVCREDLVPYGTINPRRLSAEAIADAARYRIEIGSAPRTWPEIMSACQRGEPLNLSVDGGWGFTRLDSEGCPQSASLVGTHAVLAGLGARRMRNGQWKIKCLNSWGVQYGLAGYFWVHEGHFRRQSNFDCYSVRAVELDAQDTNPPPIATGGLA